VTLSRAVDLSLDIASLEFIPGSIVMRSNQASASEEPAYQDQVLPDTVFYSDGEVVGRLASGEFGELSIVARFRSRAKGISIVVESSATGEPESWSQQRLIIAPAEPVFLRARVRNEGNELLRDIRLRFDLPEELEYADDSAMSGTSSDMSTISDLSLFLEGASLGDLQVGEERYVAIRVDSTSNAGQRILRPSATVDALELEPFFNLAVIEVRAAADVDDESAELLPEVLSTGDEGKALSISLAVAEYDDDGTFERWATQTDVVQGETVKVLITITNRGDVTIDNAVVRLLEITNYVPNSTVIINSNHPEGKALSDQQLIVGNGLNFGILNPGVNTHFTVLLDTSAPIFDVQGCSSVIQQVTAATGGIDFDLEAVASASYSVQAC